MRVMDGVEAAAIDRDLLQSPTLNRSTLNIQGRVNRLLKIWRRPAVGPICFHLGTARERSNSKEFTSLGMASECCRLNIGPRPLTFAANEEQFAGSTDHDRCAGQGTRFGNSSPVSARATGSVYSFRTQHRERDPTPKTHR